MSNKLTIDDLIVDEHIETIDTKKPLIINNRQEINKFIANKESITGFRQTKPNFYNIVPKTKLESTLSAILNNRSESVDEKNKRLTFQHNYDAKMRKIKRIKSKSYRKVKRLARKDVDCEEKEINITENPEIEEEEEEVYNDDIVDNAPIFNFTDSIKNKEQHEIVKLAFKNDMEENEEDFIKEKEEIVNENTPKIVERILPGWGDWAGPGLEIIKTKYNTFTENKEGIDYKQRKDFGSSHGIVNEGITEIDDKYKTSIPYGYSKEDYILKLNTSVSKECNTNRMYKKILNKIVQTKPGKDIEPFRYESESF